MDVNLPTDRLVLAVDERGVLRGECSSAVLPGSATIVHNGRHWATVPSFELDGKMTRAFVCDLPSVGPGNSKTEEIKVLDGFGETIASTTVRKRAGLTNAAGLTATAILALHERPFFAVPYMSFDGAVITITGAHLPPASDPSALGVEFGPGVAAAFHYPRASPSWESHFWYWPNARLSDFQIFIDLSASEPGSDPFSFRFTYAKGAQKDLPEPYGRVWIPRDLYAAVGSPQDSTQLTRVQTWSDSRSVTLTGYNVYRVVRAVFERFGIDGEGATIMDWGCGHGRVARHFIREWPRATIIGMDVDAENVDWAADNLAPGCFVTSPLMPPCDLPDKCLDGLFSISVMTHLPADVQKAWLKELARLLRPGAIALVSFGGPGAVAWSSIWNGQAYVDKWLADGIHADVVDPALDGKISDSSYYRNTAQTHENVRSNWATYFEILEILPEAVGNLDIAVLRRRPR